METFLQIKTNKTKSELRSDFLNQLNHLSSDQKNQWSKSIQKLLKNALKKESGTWAAYQNLNNEPQLIWSEVSENIQWCFPVVANELLTFKMPTSQFVKSSLGVSEPVNGETIDLNQINGVVVPALAFSQTGHRLGRGKAYYDRALNKYKGKKIGVCFGLSLQKDLPHEDHDICFHQIITESSIYQVEHSEGDTKWN